MNKLITNSKHYIENVILSKLSNVKDLGIYLDSKMTSVAYINYISKEAYRTLGFVFCAFKEFRNINSVWSLYMSYVNSPLNFGSIIWNPQYTDVSSK